MAERVGQHVQAFLSWGSSAVQARRIACRERLDHEAAGRGMTMTTNVQGSAKPSAAGEKEEAPTMAPIDAPSQAVDSKPGSKPNPNQALKSLSMPDLQAKLESSPDGLTQAEAEKRLTEYGPNQIEEKKTNEILIFLSYFWGPIPWMIEAAVILSAIDRHWPDF